MRKSQFLSNLEVLKNSLFSLRTHISMALKFQNETLQEIQILMPFPLYLWSSWILKEGRILKQNAVLSTIYSSLKTAIVLLQKADWLVWEPLVKHFATVKNMDRYWCQTDWDQVLSLPLHELCDPGQVM